MVNIGIQRSIIHNLVFFFKHFFFKLIGVGVHFIWNQPFQMDPS